jgi:hypothetical protein
MFLITLAGAVIALCGTWIMILGAHLAAVIKGFTAGNPVAGILKVSNDPFPGFGNIALLVFALRLSAVIVLDLYGGSLTLISSIDSLKRVRPALAIRIINVVITAAISGILADSQAAALEVPDTKKKTSRGQSSTDGHPCRSAVLLDRPAVERHCPADRLLEIHRGRIRPCLTGLSS